MGQQGRIPNHAAAGVEYRIATGCTKTVSILLATARRSRAAAKCEL
jgi:hypothetical protein